MLASSQMTCDITISFTSCERAARKWFDARSVPLKAGMPQQGRLGGIIHGCRSGIDLYRMKRSHCRLRVGGND
jgi:hypothetical protein